jgi:uncharacterized membrane protein HdeD (DUF308 family)
MSAAEKKSQLRLKRQPVWGGGGKQLAAVGLVMLILGLLSIGMPFLAAWTLELMLGWLLTAIGITQVVHSLRTRGTGHLAVGLLVGVLYMAVGLLLLLYPFEGMFMLTLLLSIYLIVAGIYKIVWAIKIRFLGHWGWLFLSGITALILGAIIWIQLPGAAVWVIGLIVGIDLVFGGSSLMMIGLAARRAGRK